jgi:hypothetical protein
MRNEINQPFGMALNEATATRLELGHELDDSKRHKLCRSRQPAQQCATGALHLKFEAN